MSTERRESGPVETLRVQVRERMGICACCGRGPHGVMLSAAQEIGLNWRTLRKFVTGGRVSAQALDKLHNWLTRP